MASANKPKTMAEQLTDVIECCICLGMPPARIYQCENGHLYCDECHEKMANCGVCRKRLVNFRCLSAEKVVSILKESGATKEQKIIQNGKQCLHCDFGLGCSRSKRRTS